jgi:hypothetical protein
VSNFIAVSWALVTGQSTNYFLFALLLSGVFESCMNSQSWNSYGTFGTRFAPCYTGNLLQTELAHTFQSMKAFATARRVLADCCNRGQYGSSHRFLFGPFFLLFFGLPRIVTSSRNLEAFPVDLFDVPADTRRVSVLFATHVAKRGRRRRRRQGNLLFRLFYKFDHFKLIKLLQSFP